MMPSASPFCEGMLFNCSEYGDFSMYEDFSSIGMYAAAPAAFVATPSTASPHYINSGHSHFTSPAHFSEESILAQLTPTNTSTKTIPLFMERSRSADEWSRKPVCNWDATDTIDWLFDVAKRHQLSVETLRSGAFSNIRGPQLLQMSLRDYLGLDREQGHVYFAAAQQLQPQTPLLPGRSTLDENITGLLELSPYSNPSDGNYYLPQISNESYATNRNEADCMGLSYCLPLDSSPNLNQHMQMTGSGDHPVPYHYDSNPAAGLLGDDLARSLLETGAELPQLEKIPSMKPDYKYGMDNGSSSVNQDSLDLGFDDPCWNPDGEMFSDSEENCSSADPVSRKVGRPKNKSNNRRKPDKGFGRLWEFIRDLLHDPQYCPSMVRWENVDEGIFRIVKSDKLAELWGTLKNNPNMTYEKLSRAMRYYYKGKIFEPVLGRRLVYKFGHNATNWRPKDPNFERRNGKEII